MLVEDTPIAAAAIAQLLEERNNKERNQWIQSETQGRTA
jgi:hypothetical protein